MADQTRALPTPPDPKHLPENATRLCVAVGDAQLSVLVRFPAKPARKSFTFLLVHGFAAEKTENGLFFELGRHLVRSGHTVVAYDWRGLGQSNGNFADTPLDGHARDFSTMLRVVRHMVGSSQRVVPVGFSLGSAVITLALQADQPHCRVPLSIHISPAFRPSISMWPRYEQLGALHAVATHGFFEKETRLPEGARGSVKLGRGILESIRETDLLHRNSRDDHRELLLHCTGDPRIPVEHSEDVFNANRSRAALFLFHGGDHSFRPAPTYRQRLFEVVDSWLKKPVTGTKFDIHPDRSKATLPPAQKTESHGAIRLRTRNRTSLRKPESV